MSKSRGDIVQCAAPHDIEETNSGINQRGGGNNQSAAPHDIEKTNPGINQRGGPGIKKRAEPHGIEKTNPGINQRGSPGINQSAAPHGIEKTNLGINQSAAPHGIEKPDPGINQRGGPGGMAAPHGIENPNIQLGAWMEKELKLDIPSPVSPSRCIFRVPNRLRCEREKVVHYTPQVISIGPLHHGKEALKPMEEHKKRYVQYFMGRTNNFCLMKEYKKKIEKEEAKLRSCYSETIDQYESDEFVKIILVDAIFIIEFLFRNWYPELLDENDCIFGKPWMVEDVWPDLLILENQLPFFILVDLFDPDIFPPIPSDRLKDVKKLSILFLSHYFLNGVSTFGGRSNDWKIICSSKVEHFVDFLRKLCIAPMKEQYEGQAKPTTKILSDVGQESGHMIADELVRVDVHDDVGTNELEGANLKVCTEKSLGSPASLGTFANDLEGDICEDGLRGAAMPLGTNLVVSGAKPLGASTSLGTDELEGDIWGPNNGCAMPLGTNFVSGSAIPLGTSVSLGADELEGNSVEDGLVGAAMPLGRRHRAVGAAMPLGRRHRATGAAMPLGHTSQLFYLNKKIRSLLWGPLFCQKKEAQSARQYTTTPSIEELHLAGVELEVGLTNNLFDIRFKDGILKIPKLKIEDRTELILRNLVAFEQCAFITQKKKKNESTFTECYISDYVGIMDQFVDTSKDVELLVQNEIVENLLGGGGNALSTMINSVSTGVVWNPRSSNYNSLCDDLNNFCSSKYNKRMANLRQNYFNTPWSTISFFAAVVLLLLTVVQTFCSVFSLF